MSFEYIDHSIEVAQSVDAEQLGQAELGEMIGDPGSPTRFYALEEVEAIDHVAVGIKVSPPADRFAIRNQLPQELAAISILTQRVPELMPKVPRFMAQLVVDSEVVAVLTEDATDGGFKDVSPQPVSKSVRRRLASVFCSGGATLADTFDVALFENGLAFNVAGEERLLGFDPLPIRQNRNDENILDPEGVHRAYIQANLAKLSITLPPNSPLGRTLRASKDLDEVIRLH